MSQEFAQEVTPKILSFMEEAGKIALQNQKGIKTSFKVDKSVVTEADMAISKLMNQTFADYFSRENHVLIDEEVIECVGTPEDILGCYEFAWAVDPIDGTAGYALGRKQYGISLGIFHKNKPLLGALYFPAMGELLYSEGGNVFLVESAFTNSAEKTKVIFKEIQPNRQIFVESFYADGLAWEGSPEVRVNTPESAVRGFTEALIGRSVGAASMKVLSLWDIVGAWAVAEKLGVSFLNINSGEKLTELSPNFLKENWKLAENWLLCHPNNFEKIKSVLIKKEN